jgi:hypothetical protein
MMRKRLILAAILVAVTFPPIAVSQSKDALVGTWKLVSVSASTENGEVNKTVYGPNPTGLITYTADGRMSVVLTEDGRKPLSVADRVAAPADERAQAFSTLVAYAGRYTFSGDKVIHHVEVASIQNWVNQDQVRFLTWQGDRIVLRTPPELRGGKRQTIELVWERLK